MNFQFYVSLTSYGAESDEHARLWYSSVYNALPRGTTTSVEDNGVVVRLTKARLHGCVRYTVPLSRDLSPYELNEVKHKWAASGVVGNFSITSSSTISEKMKLAADNMVLSDDEYASLCHQLMKAEHQRWYATRAEEGWTYGTIMSIFNKTHPLMRPWEDLPSEYRVVDKNNPHRLLELLGTHGFTVVKKSELDSLISLMHSVKIPV